MPLPGYYHSNPNLNVSINGINIGEGMQRADMNNALRQMMADIYDWTVAYALTPPVSIAQGGTGQTTAAAAIAALGALSDIYRGIPVTTQAAPFSFALTDRGGGIRYGGAAGAATIPPFASVAWPVGTAILIRNAGSGVLTITRGAGVALAKNGGTASADAALAIGGVASLVNWGIDEWSVTGSGIS